MVRSKRFKYFISLLLMMITVTAWSQTSFPSSFFNNYQLTHEAGISGLHFSNASSDRYTFSFYRPLSLDNLQVVSIHQADIQQDIVYFIDKKGQTHFRAYASTAPVNYGLHTWQRDSFNPYGVKDFKASLMTGFLNALFGSNRIRFVNR